MFRNNDTFSTVRPYVDRAIQDEDVRNSVLRAFTAARRVYGDLSGDGPLGAASKISGDRDVRENLDTTVQSLSEAIVRMSGKSPKRDRSWKGFVFLAFLAFVLFNPATGAQTRSWIKDHLFGSEEEFDYGTPQY